MGGRAQHADATLLPQLSGGQWAHLCLWRNRVRQGLPQQLRGVRPHHPGVSCRHTTLPISTSRLSNQKPPPPQTLKYFSAVSCNIRIHMYWSVNLLCRRDQMRFGHHKAANKL